MLKFDINPRHAEGFDANLMILPDISIGDGRQGKITWRWDNRMSAPDGR
jgi:hypothetical protein